MNDDLFKEKLSKFLTVLASLSHDISKNVVGHWAIIGSSSLAVHGIAPHIPKDINIVMDDAAFSEFNKYTGMTPERSHSSDKRLRFNIIVIAYGGKRCTFLNDMEFMSPLGNWEKIRIQDLRTETVIKNGQRYRNILTVGGYMALAGMFNRSVDRARLEMLADKTKTYVSGASFDEIMA